MAATSRRADMRAASELRPLRAIREKATSPIPSLPSLRSWTSRPPGNLDCRRRRHLPRPRRRPLFLLIVSIAFYSLIFYYRPGPGAPSQVLHHDWSNRKAHGGLRGPLLANGLRVRLAADCRRRTGPGLGPHVEVLRLWPRRFHRCMLDFHPLGLLLFLLFFIVDCF